MPHPSVDNSSLLTAEPLYLTDEEGRPTLTIVVKATFDLRLDGRLTLLEEQPPLSHAGEFWGHPGQSSVKVAPEATPIKVATDIAVIAHAHAPGAGTTTLDASVRVGALSHRVRVFGERHWRRRVGALALTRPESFERIPIIYERAYGGCDTTASDPSRHACEPRNPLGQGFHARGGPGEGERAPSIEDPTALIQSPHDRPSPAGFGFIPEYWSPRAQLAGTYDREWEQTRRPLLPKDFDPRFYNSATPALISSGFLRGDEPVEVLHLTPQRKVHFCLPGLPPPAVRVSLAGREDQRPALNLDTVVLDLNRLQVVLLWRSRLRLRSGPHDVRSLSIESPGTHRLLRGSGLFSANRSSPRSN